MLEVRNITKKYGSNLAVDNLSFTIEQGKIYGLLGPNGAGKSTTMNIITGCLAATSGTVLINGHDIFAEPREAKRHIGYLPEIPPLYTDMTPYEFLMFVVEAKGVDGETGIRQVREVMDLTQLNPVGDRLIRNLSKGYRQRVGIAQAMLGNPDLIILDEPTVGLDPKQIVEIRDLIRRLGKIKTVILSSHILAEISEVCDHVMIISHGRLVADDTIENLENNAGENLRLRVIYRGGDLTEKFATLDGVLSAKTSDCDGELITELVCDRDIRESIPEAVRDGGAVLLGLEREKLTLEDIFMRATAETDVPKIKIKSKEPSEAEAVETEPAPKPKKHKCGEDDDYVPQFSHSNSDNDDGEAK